jgi:hypothetical protein
MIAPRSLASTWIAPRIALIPNVISLRYSPTAA